ncbi:MAG: hypothetical protein L0Z73_10770 [Gammaproteobacteria bacterium]|nr:hypothetical protein [Gammaproteobacteria bacterium]
MRIIKKVYLAALISLAWHNISAAAFNFDPSLNWTTLRTEHFHIHYHDGEEALAQKAAQISERAHQRISTFFQWEPREPTQLVLIDRMDFSNAFAMPLPRNTMYIIVTPPDGVDTIDNYHDWLDLVISHEYTHIVHVDMVAGLAKGARNIFGRQILFFPNALQPPWVLEGIATYNETRIAPGSGRGENSSFRSLMRLEVESGIKPLSQVNQPIVSWPAGNTRYLYGVYFFNFLIETYGEQQAREWFQQYSENLIPFLMNTTAKSVFNKNMAALWLEFEDYLRKQFNPEIDAIKEKGLTTGRQLTHYGYTTGQPRSLPNGDVLFVKQDWLQEPRLMLLPFGGGDAKEITTVHSDRFDAHPQAGVLIAEIDLVDNVNSYSDLHHIDIATGKRTQLTRGKRYKHAAWSPDGKSIAAVQVEGGNSALHLLSSNGEYRQTLWQSGNFEIISELDWSPGNNSIVAAVWRPQTRWNLELFDLDTQRWRPLTTTRGVELQPQFIHDGSALLYSADYDGVYNIYKLELDSRQATQITNALGSALSATQLPNSQDFFYLGLHANGADIYQLAEENAVNKAVDFGALPEPYAFTAVYSDEQRFTDTATYSALDKLAPTGWFPYLSLTEERSEFGVNVFGADPLNRHQYSLTLAYDAQNNWPIGWFDYRYDRWRVALKAFYEHTVLTVLDAQDNLNSFRDSDTLTLEAILPFLTRDQQWSFHFGASANRESDKEVEPNGVPLLTTRDELLGAAVTFNSAKYFPRAISLDDGFLWRAVAEDSDTLDSDFTGQVYSVDWRGYFNLHRQHVLAAQVSAGRGTDDPNPFRLGGSDQDFSLVPPMAALMEPTTHVFNRREYPLRGYPTGLRTLTGRRLLSANLEWRFPVALIENGLMAPPAGIHQVHGALFYSAGDAWDDRTESADYVTSAGVEFNVELVLGYIIPINLRLGYAHGFDAGGEDQWYINTGFTF